MNRYIIKFPGTSQYFLSKLSERDDIRATRTKSMCFVIKARESSTALSIAKATFGSDCEGMTAHDENDITLKPYFELSQRSKNV